MDDISYDGLTTIDNLNRFLSMKTSIQFLLLALSILFFSSCCDTTGNVELQFKLEYDGEPLVMFEDYTYPDGQELFFTRFSFYLSELTIGDQIIDGVKLMDLTPDHTTLEKSQIGTIYTLENLELEDVTGLSFKIGLSPEINSTAPADYPSANDLSIVEEYWSPWDSYIFSKTEAKLDSDGDGSKELLVALHLGLDDALRSVNLETTFDVYEDNTIVKEIVIDLKKYFDGTQGVYDIIAVPQIHQTNTIAQINELADNLVEAISIR